MTVAVGELACRCSKYWALAIDSFALPYLIAAVALVFPYSNLIVSGAKGRFRLHTSPK